MTPVSYTDLVALRDHLRAEAERARSRAVMAQRWAARHWKNGHAWAHAEDARRCADAWRAADTRLRTLEALIARHDWLTTQVMAPSFDVHRWQRCTYVRGELLAPDELTSLSYAPCAGGICEHRECVPCGLRRMGAQ